MINSGEANSLYGALQIVDPDLAEALVETWRNDKPDFLEWLEDQDRQFTAFEVAAR